MVVGFGRQRNICISVHCVQHCYDKRQSSRLVEQRESSGLSLTESRDIGSDQAMTTRRPHFVIL